MKREVDQLQIAAAEKTRPWYRNVSTLLSVIALLFSFGTTAVSYVRTRQQDVQAARVELRTLVQKLTELPKEMIDKSIAYKGDTNALDGHSRLVNQENVVLSRQAAEIINRIETHVGAGEFYAVAYAMLAGGQMKEAEELGRRGLAVADSSNDESALLRMLADLAFLRGDLEDGRVLYRRALALPTKYGETNRYLVSMTNFSTELAWSGSEFGAGRCVEAQAHLDGAQVFLEKLTDGAQKTIFSGQLTNARQMLGRCF